MTQVIGTDTIATVVGCACPPGAPSWPDNSRAVAENALAHAARQMLSGDRNIVIQVTVCARDRLEQGECRADPRSGAPKVTG